MPQSPNTEANSNSSTDSSTNSGSSATQNGQSTERPKRDDVPDMSGASAQDELSPKDRHERAIEIIGRLNEGRSYSSTVTLLTELEPPHEEIVCDIHLDKLDRQLRWDCLSQLPDGLIRQAEAGDESQFELEADVVPDGEGVGMIELIFHECLNPKGVPDGDWTDMVSNHISDDVIIEVGVELLGMSFDQGEITGFRFD